MLQIIRELDIWFYALNIWKAIAIAMGVIVFWALLAAIISECKPKLWRVINATAILIAVAVIFYATLFRTENGRNLILQPFNTFVRAQKNREAYREALMNVILFIPIGLTLPNILPYQMKTGKRIAITLLISALFSITLESCQYIFFRGTTETDDVITNSIGALFGMTHLSIVSLLGKVRLIKKE